MDILDTREVDTEVSIQRIRIIANIENEKNLLNIFVFQYAFKSLTPCTGMEEGLVAQSMYVDEVRMVEIET